MGQRKKILIVAKTYPLPSKSYKEIVCTGGVLEDGSYIRLYPIDYRYKPYWEWYKKYQWIEVEIEKNKDDPRPESYSPVKGSHIKILGPPLPTRNNWEERKKYVLKKKPHTMCELNRLSRENRCTLGIIRPNEVFDLIIEEDEREWKEEWKVLFQQQELFGPGRKPLEKIPYKFSYKFKCEESDCSGHKMMIADWEVGRLYRRMRDGYRDEKIAVEKVKYKLFNEICGLLKDTHFFVGTIYRYRTWIIAGTFYPDII